MTSIAGGTLPMETNVVSILQGSDTGIIIPVLSDLTGYAVRSQLRASVKSADVLAEWSTANEQAEIKPYGVMLHVPAALSSTWDFAVAIADVEVVSPTGQITRIATFRVRLDREVTR